MVYIYTNYLVYIYYEKQKVYIHMKTKSICKNRKQLKLIYVYIKGTKKFTNKKSYHKARQVTSCCAPNHVKSHQIKSNHMKKFTDYHYHYYNRDTREQ